MTTQTIPADDFGLDGDRAWWIVDHPTCERHSSCKCGRFGLPHCTMSCEMERPSDLARVKALDRPCDTCDGAQRIQEDASDAHGRPCHDCIAGRHTWNIRVAVQYDDLENAWIGAERAPQYDHVGSESSRVTSALFRVSVVPGMVLEIGDDDTTGEGFLYCGADVGPNWIIVGGGVDQDDIHLPPGARPGRFAVLLNVERIAT